MADGDGSPRRDHRRHRADRPDRRHRATARPSRWSRPGSAASGRWVAAMGVPSADVLRALDERDLVFELMAHPDQLEPVGGRAGRLRRPHRRRRARRAGRGPTRPRSARSGQRGISALAALGDNVHCKLSGLAMPLHSMRGATVLRPWIEHCLDSFGVDRCMFASNFPVDAMHGTFDELYSALRRAPPPTSTPTRATSSSPPTPSGSTAADRRSQLVLPHAR